MALELDARLRAFAAVARHGSFSRAAEALLLSQPAVSRNVAALEQELGIQLLERGWRRVTLTSAGDLLADHVLRAEALLSQGERRVHALTHGVAGTLSIAASGTPGNYLLPALIATFHDAHPAVHIEMEAGTSAETAEAVRSHRAEIGFVGGMAAAPEVSTQALMEDEIVIVGSSARFADGERVSADALGDVAWIEREEGSATRTVTEAALADVGLAPRHRLVLPGWEMVKLAVAAGAGVAAISRLAIDVELRAGTLRVLDVPGWQVRRHISVITARDVRLTPAADRFLALVRERANTLSPAGR
jgi:LysR family transcriptional regulator, transcriptional activator of the cysJI operon